MNTYCRTWIRLFTKIWKYFPILIFLVPMLAFAQSEKPNVAILVYDGVQVIDHAVPFEVFGQFSLNNVYLVAADSDPVTTYMGMQIIPNYSFADAPTPDVLVLPGGDAGEAQKDPDIARWIEQMTTEAGHVLTVCTGIFFLAENDILKGKQVTTWYDRQEELQGIVPDAEVISDRLVVESGKLVSSAGLGVEGALHVLTRLHGKAWSEVVRLNMEHESVSEEHHIPRVELADMMLPNTVYSAFPWRDAELLNYEGDRNQWTMEWRFNSGESLDSLSEEFRRALVFEEGWKFVSDEVSGDEWESKWTIEGEAETESGAVIRLRKNVEQVDLTIKVSHQNAN